MLLIILFACSSVCIWVLCRSVDYG